MEIRDRIKSMKRIKASELIPNESNWRTHPQAQKDALSGVLEEVGIAGAIIVRPLAGGKYQIIDGHMRADVSPDTKWPCLVLDVDESEAAKLLATYDPISAMASADATKLDALLREIDTGSEALQAMLAELAEDAGLYRVAGEQGENDPEAEWEGMPEFEQDDASSFKQLIVHFGDAVAVADFQAKIGQVFSDKAKYIWHPKQVRADLKSVACSDES